MRLLLAEQQKVQSQEASAAASSSPSSNCDVWFGASQTSDLGLRPNDIIFWQAINDARRDGFQVFDFGEVPEGMRLARFKSKWAPSRTSPRYYYPDFPDAGSRLRTTNLFWRVWPGRLASIAS